jgi:hypothetical protein
MPKFLFWNLNRREIPGWVHNLARQEGADVLILAECAMTPAQLLVELNTESSDYQYAPGNCGHLVFFTGFDARFLTPLLESHRVSIRRLTLPGRQPILVAAAHLPSKLNFSDDDQVFESVHLAGMIDEVERREGHQRTILLGDLNMNPFETGMVAARGGLHAVMDRRVAARLTRTVQMEKYKFFYNPMWGHFGDRGDTGGTYFFESHEPICYFWNILDQVLLRPGLLDGFEHEHVRILTSVRDYSLLDDDGRPDKSMFSDHLPVLLELNF